MKEKALKTTAGKILARNAIMNFIGQMTPMIVAIFAIPVLIKELSEDKFGILTLVWAVIGYSSLFDLGLGRALTQLVAEKLGKDETQGLPTLIMTSLALMLCLGLIGTIVISALSPLIIRRVLTIPVALQSDALKAFYLVAITIPLVIVTTGLRGILEAQQQFVVLNWIKIGTGVFTFIAPLLIIPFSHNLTPIVFILFVGRGITLWLHFWVCIHTSSHFLRRLRGERLLSLDAIIPLLRYGGWMTISNIINPFMVYLDRFFIGSFISVAASAYYVTPYEIVTKMWLIPGAIGGVLFPAFAASFAQDAHRVRELFGQGIKYVYLAVFPVSLVTVALAFEGLNLWLGKDYADNSTSVAQWLTVGVFINCIAQVAFALVQGIGRPDLTAKFHLLEFPLYLVLIFAGLKYLGITGVAIAWVIRVIVDTTLLLCLAYRSLPQSGDSFKEVLVLVGISSFLLIGAMFLSSLQAKLFYLVICLTGLSLVAWLKLISPREKRWLGKCIGLFPI